MIKLGLTPDTMRMYPLKAALEHRRATANPYAPGISNQGSYSQLDGWAEWTAEDWSSGIGFKNPDEGMYNAIATTMFSRKAMLPLRPFKVGILGNDPSVIHGPGSTLYDISSSYSYSVSTPRLLKLGAGGDGYGYAIPITNAQDATQPTTVSLYGYLPPSITITAKLYDGSTFSSATLLGTETTTGIASAPPVMQWIDLQFDGGYTPSNNIWMEIRVDNSANTSEFFYWKIINNTNAAKDGRLSTSASTDRSLYAESYLIPRYNTNLESECLLENGIGLATSRQAIIYGSYLVRGHSTSGVAASLAWLSGSFYGTYSPGSLSSTAITSLCVWGSNLYASLGASTRVMTTSGSDSSAGFASRMLLKYKGYLWRITTGNEISYSIDASTWQTVGTFYPTTEMVLAMAGMANCPYWTTAQGLWRVSDGDFIEFITEWNGTDYPSKGRYLTNVGEKLYTIVDEQTIWAIDTGHQIANILQSNSSFLDRGASPVAIGAVKDYLCVAMKHGDTELLGYDLYLYRNSTWHYLAPVPTTNPVVGILWDKTRKTIIVQIEGDTTYYYKVGNLSTSYDYAALANFEPEGWIEYDRQNGGKPTLSKEWEAVFADITLQPYTAVEIYGKYAGQTALGWQKIYPLEGDDPTYSSSTWEDVLQARITTETAFGRQATKWAKIGIRFSTQDATCTPILHGISLQYLPNVTDRWQWNLVIDVHEESPLEDGSLNEYTVAEQRAHLESIIRAETLVYLEDLDGRIYGCKVLSGTNSPTVYDPNSAGDLEEYKENYPEVYQITLQQFEEVTA